MRIIIICTQASKILPIPYPAARAIEAKNIVSNAEKNLLGILDPISVDFTNPKLNNSTAPIPITQMYC